MQRKNKVWDVYQHTTSNTGVALTLPNKPGLYRESPLYGISLRWTGRLTLTGSAGTIVCPEAGPNVFQKITVKGTIKGKGDQVIFDMDGAMAQRYAQIFYGGTAYENTSTPALATSNGSYDIAVTVPIYFVQPGLPDLPVRDANGNRLPSMTDRTLLMANRFSSLILEVTFANGANFVNGPATRALTAFGSGTGNPQCTVTVMPVNMGAFQDTLPVALLKRTVSMKYQLLTNVVQGAIGPTLNTGSATNRLLVRTGTLVSGNTEYPAMNTLSDTVVTRAQIRRNDIPIQDGYWQEVNQLNKGEYKLEQWPVGYHVINLVQDGDPTDALKTFLYNSKNVRLNFGGDATTVSNAEIDIMQEEVTLQY